MMGDGGALRERWCDICMCAMDRLASLLSVRRHHDPARLSQLDGWRRGSLPRFSWRRGSDQPTLVSEGWRPRGRKRLCITDMLRI